MVCLIPIHSGHVARNVFWSNGQERLRDPLRAHYPWPANASVSPPSSRVQNGSKTSTVAMPRSTRSMTTSVPRAEFLGSGRPRGHHMPHPTLLVDHLAGASGANRRADATDGAGQPVLLRFQDRPRGIAELPDGPLHHRRDADAEQCRDRQRGDQWPVRGATQHERDAAEPAQEDQDGTRADGQRPGVVACSVVHAEIGEAKQ